jgi:hypothetical protein
MPVVRKAGRKKVRYRQPFVGRVDSVLPADRARLEHAEFRIPGNAQNAIEKAIKAAAVGYQESRGSLRYRPCNSDSACLPANPPRPRSTASQPIGRSRNASRLRSRIIKFDQARKPRPELVSIQAGRGCESRQVLRIVEVGPFQTDHVTARAFVRLAVDIHLALPHASRLGIDQLRKR